MRVPREQPCGHQVTSSPRAHATTCLWKVQAEGDKIATSRCEAKEVRDVEQRAPKIHPAHHVQGGSLGVPPVDLVLRRVGVAVQCEVGEAEEVAEGGVGLRELARDLAGGAHGKQRNATWRAGRWVGGV